MYKKALLSATVTSALIFSAGCEVSSVEDNDKVDQTPISETPSPELSNFPQGTHPVFALLPAQKRLPLAIDLLFADAAKTDGTAATADTRPPVTNALNDLDGFSLTAAIDIPFSGELNPATVIPGTVLLVSQADPLKPGVDYSVSLVKQAETPVVRITPNRPLKPGTRYLVIISDQILDSKGKKIVRAHDFALLNTTDTPVASLQGAITAVRNWTKLAGGALQKIPGKDLGAKNVALAYSFTTGGSDTILKSMAAPLLHLKSDRLVAGATIAGALNPPKSRNFQLIQSSPGTPFALTPNALGISPDPITRYVQGGLTIPVGFKAPVLTDLAALKSGDTSAISKSMASDSIWRANTALGTVIDGATGKASGTTPPKDSDGTTNVTYRYPHAALNETQTVPLLITVPGNYTPIGGPDCTADAAKPWKVAIFVHGITADRTASVGVGNALASKACIATVAIDLPMHGVAPIRSGKTNGLKVFNAEQNLAGYPFGQTANATGIKINERHYNVGNTPQTSVARVPMNFEASKEAPLSGESGRHFINLFNFQRTRDNMRQAVVDLLNLSASVGSMDVTGDGKPDLDANNINFLGHSLGGILGLTFVSVINDPAVQAANSALPQIKTAIFGNPGTQMTKLLENSPAFAPSIVGALKGAGIAQGSTSFESFLQVMQGTIASADPVNFAKQLASTDTPVLVYNMVGGGDIGSDTAALPEGIAKAFPGKYPPDHVVPNYDYFKDSNNPYAFMALGGVLPASQTTAQSSLAGTNPLIKLMGLTRVDAGSSSISQETPIKAAIILQKGTHASFAGADAKTTFNEIIKQIITFISSGGKTLPVDNSNDVYAPAANK